MQGCPWSVIVFQQGIENWPQWTEHSFSTVTSPQPVRGYVDDVRASGTTKEQSTEAGRTTEDFLQSTGMQKNHPKRGDLQGRRSGNKWHKKDKTADVRIAI